MRHRDSSGSDPIAEGEGDPAIAQEPPPRTQAAPGRNALDAASRCATAPPIPGGAPRAAQLDSSTALLLQDLLPGTGDDPFEPPAPARIGRYRVIALIGAGAFAKVYKAIDTEGGGECIALKCLTPSVDGETDGRAARFVREAEILRTISHPNVVRLIEFGTEPVLYLAMELVPGGDLKTRLAAGTPWTLAGTLALARGVLCGIGAIHAAGIVHRDVKPANVLLRENHEPVVADLGMGKVFGPGALTGYSMLIGTIAYMAPEQLRGAHVDRRTDLYAIGCILFQMLTGRLPFNGANVVEVIRRISEAPAPPIAALKPDLPPALAAFVDTLLAKDPARRYDCAAEALAALDGIAAEIP